MQTCSIHRAFSTCYSFYKIKLQQLQALSG